MSNPSTDERIKAVLALCDIEAWEGENAGILAERVVALLTSPHSDAGAVEGAKYLRDKEARQAAYKAGRTDV